MSYILKRQLETIKVPQLRIEVGPGAVGPGSQLPDRGPAGGQIFPLGQLLLCNKGSSFQKTLSCMLVYEHDRQSHKYFFLKICLIAALCELPAEQNKE